jgi:hypothetical protein
MIALQQTQVIESTDLKGEVRLSMRLPPHFGSGNGRQQRGQEAANPETEVSHQKSFICGTNGDWLVATAAA